MHYSRAEKSPNVPDDAFKRIWGGSKIKLFLSHKAEEKENTSKLKDALQNVCGISSFVAHEDIHPTEEWQKEIENALFSMDALVALLTDGFKDSNWTDQEVGVAIGRGVPVIPVKISIIPYGFIGKYQALPGSGWDTPENMALKIFKTLYDCLPDNSLLFDCALEKYSNSPSYDDSSNRLRDLLSVFETLNENQITRVLEAYNSNDQNYKSRTGNDELIKLLYKWTGKRWLIINNELQPI